jgi:hypothetical protein
MSIAKGLALNGPRRLDFTAAFINAFNHPIYFAAATRILYVNSVGVFNTPANFGNLNPGNTSGFSRVIARWSEIHFLIRITVGMYKDLGESPNVTGRGRVSITDRTEFCKLLSGNNPWQDSGKSSHNLVRF